MKPLTMEELAYWRDLAKSALNEDHPPGIDLPPQTVLCLLAAAERSCMRPIATAPTDGTEVIIHDGYDHFQNATCYDGFWISKVTGEIIHDPIGWYPIPGEGGV